MDVGGAPLANIQAKDGRSALHFAVGRKHLAIMRKLGAFAEVDINKTAENGSTPLDIAIGEEFISGVRCLAQQPRINLGIRNRLESYNRWKFHGPPRADLRRAEGGGVIGLIVFSGSSATRAIRRLRRRLSAPSIKSSTTFASYGVSSSSTWQSPSEISRLFPD